MPMTYILSYRYFTSKLKTVFTLRRKLNYQKFSGRVTRLTLNFDFHTLSYEELEEMFKNRQRHKDAQEYEEAQKLTNKIGRQLRKERVDKTINGPEDNLWHDIKQARTTFIPSHANLLNNEQKPCTSDERPDISADYFEQTRWAIDNDRDEETNKSRVAPHLNKPIIKNKRLYSVQMNSKS